MSADTMLAWTVHPTAPALLRVTRRVPAPAPHELLLHVRACGVCRTDLHLIDKELPPHRATVVPGHEIVGEVAGIGGAVAQHQRAPGFALGQRVGVPWLGGSCGQCPYCASARENLCDAPAFTGWDRDGGYAEYCVADARYCLPLPARYDDVHAAPLLCPGLIGWRSWRLAGGAQPRRLGLWGFGAAAHLVCQMAVAQGQQVFAFTRAGDQASQALALSLGASWAGSSDDAPPDSLDASILFAPAGELVPAALAASRKGGVVVCGGIHMSTIPAFEYSLLWGERQLRSVANLTRTDGREFMAAAERLDLRVQAQAWPLREADQAVDALRAGRVQGAAVLVP